MCIPPITHSNNFVWLYSYVPGNAVPKKLGLPLAEMNDEALASSIDFEMNNPSTENVSPFVSCKMRILDVTLCKHYH